MISVGGAGGWAAVGLDFVSFGPTPIALALTLIVLAALLAGLATLLSVALGSLVDRRWGADQPLTPTETLWGEMGSNVQNSFPGLDPEIAEDLTPFVSEMKVAAGGLIIEAGSAVTHYYVITKGTAQTTTAAGVLDLGPGSGIGQAEILGRSTMEAHVVATSDCALLVLPAEDFVAGVALGADHDDDEYVLNALTAYAAPAATATLEAAAPSPVAVLRWAAASHVTIVDAGAMVLPEGDQVTRVLSAGTEVRITESLMGWAHVATEDGWHGWVRDTEIGQF